VLVRGPSPIVDRSDTATITSLLWVSMLREDPPSLLAFTPNLAPDHVRVVEEGARLRARLPAYLARRWALLDEHCLLIPPLRALVRDYDPGPTTTEDV
jgi:hypothetical protein